METYRLREGGMIPKIGLGTWQLNDVENIKELLEEAIKIECILIDTAAAYTNEIAISKALRELSIPREKLFIQDKLWNTCRGYVESQEACKRSLRKLKLEYLDAYLIHWPASPKLYEDWEEINAETWRGLEKLKAEGLARVIGVCNFKRNHLDKLRYTAKEMPEINQIEFHPGFCQKDTLDYCMENDILLEASSPLGKGKILHEPVLVKIARKYGKTPAQVCLRWELEKGFVVIPKTSKVERLYVNCNIFDFSLTNYEKSLIDGIANFADSELVYRIIDK